MKSIYSKLVFDALLIQGFQVSGLAEDHVSLELNCGGKFVSFCGIKS